MILIVTNKLDYTTDFLILELRKRGVDYVRFNTEDFPQRVQIGWQAQSKGLDGYFSFSKSKVSFQDIRSIWYRRPVPPIPETAITDEVAYEFALAESQSTLDGIWRSLDCFWVSHPDSLKRSEHKPYQLIAAAQIGLSLPPTLLTNIPDEARKFFTEHEGKIIYKPLKRGRIVRGGNIRLIYTNPVDLDQAHQFDYVQYAPVLLQGYVPKQVEIRVTVIGNKAFAVEIHSQEDEETIHDWRRGNTMSLSHKWHVLPRDIEDNCITLVRKLGLAFGAIDLILTPESKYVFLEINPNGQWAWIQQLCPEIPLRETLADVLVAATTEI